MTEPDPDAERELRQYLNQSRRWLPFSKGWRLRIDPVRMKNLEKCAGCLHALRPSLADPKVVASLAPLLEQLKTPETISADSAWELADALERQLLERGDDLYVKTLFVAELHREKGVQGEGRLHGRDLAPGLARSS